MFTTLWGRFLTISILPIKKLTFRESSILTKVTQQVRDRPRQPDFPQPSVLNCSTALFPATPSLSLRLAAEHRFTMTTYYFWNSFWKFLSQEGERKTLFRSQKHIRPKPRFRCTGVIYSRARLHHPSSEKHVSQSVVQWSKVSWIWLQSLTLDTAPPRWPEREPWLLLTHHGI